jgi:hypothetical protein
MRPELPTRALSHRLAPRACRRVRFDRLSAHTDMRHELVAGWLGRLRRRSGVTPHKATNDRPLRPFRAAFVALCGETAVWWWMGFTSGEPSAYRRRNQDQRSERQRWRSANAAALGCRSRVNAPFLLPPTRMMPEVVVKSAKFQTCSPTTASIRSNTRWFMSR